MMLIVVAMPCVKDNDVSAMIDNDVNNQLISMGDVSIAVFLV
jgi:hypothetical protein